MAAIVVGARRVKRTSDVRLLEHVAPTCCEIVLQHTLDNAPGDLGPALRWHAVLIDVHSKVLADNLACLVCMGAAEVSELDSTNRICNRAYAARCLQRLLPRMVLGLGCIATLLDKAFSLLGTNSNRVVPGRSSPRNKSHVKPHPNLAYKG